MYSLTRLDLIFDIIAVYTREEFKRMLPQGNLPRKMVSEAILGHFKQFLNTVNRLVRCSCAYVLYLG